ncbi:MAG: response regulator [Chloroflexi bacterium]|nr:response regulator [Chloroflexota bacterium]MCL5275318.1 response regulator [Chloroflexota bacterium]
MSEPGYDSSFVHHVQQALTGLYSPAELRRSRLIVDLNLDRQTDQVTALRRALVNAIMALQPDANAPLSSNAWRVYHILTYRFLEQSSQKQVATDLALSIRQLRRDEGEAVQVLADFLWAQYHPASQAEPRESAPAHTDDLAPIIEAPSHKQELDWLRQAFPGETADVIDIISSALNTLEPVIRSASVQVKRILPAQRPPLVLSQPGVLRQAVINLLLATINYARNTTIQVGIEMTQDQVQVRIQTSAVGREPPDAQVNEALDMTRELLTICGGSLKVQAGSAAGFAAVMCLPAKVLAAMAVLIIDDHADAQQLMQRYLSGSRYEFHGCRDPEKALATAVELAPQVIILDVMLPGIDGWELLDRLRLNPVTAQVPVIVSTFMPQEQVALALGAAAFLRKPFSQQQLLAALDRQVELQSKESR